MGGVVLLTGGTGFLGSQVVQGVLKSTEHTMVALVRARDAESATGVGRSLIRPMGVA